MKANISTSDVGAEGEVAVEDDVPAVEGGDNVVTLEGAGAPGDEAVWAANVGACADMARMAVLLLLSWCAALAARRSAASRFST